MTINNTPLTADRIDRIARKRAGAKLGWYIHASVYLNVNFAWYWLAASGTEQRS